MATRKRRKKGPAKARRGFTVEQLQQLGVDVEAFRRQHPMPQALAVRSALHAGPKRNATEARYAEWLGLQQQLGQVSCFVFEPLKLRLGPDWLTTYTPDFLVVFPDGVVELVDVKGASNSKGSKWGAWWEEDALLKIKLAAGIYPFRFVGVHEEEGGGWARKVFPPCVD